jgi:anti-sigma regulatory factor (Ser/Thr protein kinase)
MKEIITLPGTLPSLEPVRNFVKAAAEEAGLDKRQSYRLVLAIDEIATNVIIHGYQESDLEGSITLQVEVSDTKLTIFMEDTGLAYEPLSDSEPEDLSKPLGERHIGGLGVFLAIHNVDRFLYERVDSRNRHIFVVFRNSPPENV